MCHYARTFFAVLALAMPLGPGAARGENIVFPDDAGVVDVTAAPYHLRGDGTTDNTAALQRAFDDLRGSSLTLYFPDGVYRFSDGVGIFDGKAHSRDRFLHLQGQSRAGTILRLADASPGFDDAENPKVFLSLYEGQSTGDAIHSGYVRDLTVEVGAGNPGAAALRFMSNNSGAMYDVTVRSADPERAGAIGLDLRQSQNGPALIKRVTVQGFDVGIKTGNTFSLVFEHVTLERQREVGWHNRTARSTMRGLVSRNDVTAVLNDKHGELTLIEAELTASDSKGASGGASEGGAAIVSDNRKLFLRDVRVAGYDLAVRAPGGVVSAGESIDEYHGGRTYGLFSDEPRTSLRLPIRETPRIPWEQDLGKWQRVEPGVDTIQRAIDEAAAEGKTTLYFPKGRPGDKSHRFVATRPVRVHGSIRRVIAMENILWVDEAFPVGETLFVLEGLDGPIVFERFFNVLKHRGWKGLRDRYLIENRTGRPAIMANMAHGALTFKKPAPGQTWYLEDFVSKLDVGPGETVWARQFNPESPNTDMVRIDGGRLWVLGMKTEGRATHIHATGGAEVELLGGVSYQSWNNQPLDPPMFKVVDSRVSITFGRISWKTPFSVFFEETRDGVTRRLERGEIGGAFIPLYRSGEASPSAARP